MTSGMRTEKYKNDADALLSFMPLLRTGPEAGCQNPQSGILLSAHAEAN